jgi:hypothetical protein
MSSLSVVSTIYNRVVQWGWRWHSHEGICYIVWPNDRVSEAVAHFPCHDFVTATRQGQAWADYYNLRDAITEAMDEAWYQGQRLDALLEQGEGG